MCLDAAFLAHRCRHADFSDPAGPAPGDSEGGAVRRLPVALELGPVPPCSTAEMMVNRNIWTVAAWLVAKHGPSASKVVSARIAKLRDEPTESSAITCWLQVDHAVHELTRAPDDGERIN